jgi:hypothetical protein
VKCVICLKPNPETVFVPASAEGCVRYKCGNCGTDSWRSPGMIKRGDDPRPYTKGPPVEAPEITARPMLRNKSIGMRPSQQDGPADVAYFGGTSSLTDEDDEPPCLPEEWIDPDTRRRRRR